MDGDWHAAAAKEGRTQRQGKTLACNARLASPDATATFLEQNVIAAGSTATHSFGGPTPAWYAEATRCAMMSANS